MMNALRLYLLIGAAVEALSLVYVNEDWLQSGVKEFADDIGIPLWPTAGLLIVIGIVIWPITAIDRLVEWLCEKEK